MCRSKSEVSGGRICPGCRGKKHRARQRAYYNASDVEEQYENSTRHEEEDVQSQETNDKIMTIEEVWNIPLDELKEKRELIREEVNDSIEDVRQKYTDIEYKMLQKLSGVDENNIHIESGETVDEEKILKKKDDLIKYYDRNYREIFKDKGDFLQDDILEYEDAVRNVGSLIDTSTMITMREMMVEEGFTEENFNTPGSIQDIAIKYDEEIDTLVFKSRRLQARLKEEEGDSNSVRSRISAGKAIDQQEFYDYLKEEYADSRDEDGNVYMDESEIVSHVFRAVDIAQKESKTDKTWKQFRYSELGRKKFGEDQYGSTVQIPKSALAQKKVLEMFDASRAFPGEHGLDNKVKSMISGNINTIMNDFYIRAYQSESSQSFGNSEIPVVYRNYNNESDMNQTIKESMGVYPDSMIERAQIHHMPLCVQVKRGGTARNPSRAHFKEREEIPVKFDSPLSYSFDSFDEGYLEPSSNPDTIKIINNVYEQGFLDDRKYTRMMDEEFVRVDDEESIRKLDKAIEKRNNDYSSGTYGGDKDKFQKVGVDISNGGIRLIKEEFMDAVGVKRYKVVSDNDFEIHTKKMVSLLSTNGDKNVTIHELGHYIEVVPGFIS